MMNVLVVVNSGADAITDWHAEVYATSNEPVWDPPAEVTWRGVMSNAGNGALPPGRQIEARVPDHLDGVARAQVTFTDADGRRWRRTGSESVVRVAD
jgi:hypothetical protein